MLEEGEELDTGAGTRDQGTYVEGGGVVKLEEREVAKGFVMGEGAPPLLLAMRDLGQWL